MYLAIDIGGTNGRVVAFASADDPTSELGSERFDMTEHSEERPGDFEQDFSHLITACGVLMGKFGRAESVGFAVAGKLNPSRTEIVLGGNIAHWVGQPIAQRLEGPVCAPVVLGNDAEAAALAEAKWGVGSQQPFIGRDFIQLIWGSGVGGACVRHFGGKRYAIPGEYGHITVAPEDPYFCRDCDEPGHLEAMIGGNNLPAFYGKSVMDFDEGTWEVIADTMLVGLRSILMVQPVDLIVMSGGVACKQAWLLPRLEQSLDQPRYGSPELVLSRFGESAGIAGALALLNS